MNDLRQNVVASAPVLRSPAMLKLVRTVQAVAAKDVGLTFIGESGSGKEVLARMAHELSERRQGPFIPINCAAIPEALFESELFGHERGSFTGATHQVRGKIESAENGTLFLDEIGDMPITVQAKLLRFLEHRRYMRVGSSTKLNANVRLICATLRALDKDVASGRFRADLYYRIQGITLHVPPLRERRADIGPLVAYFIAQLSNRHALVPPRLTREVKSLLLAHDWPGNVRELRNVVESLCLLRDGRRARVTDLPDSITAHPTRTSPLPGIISATTSMTIRLEDGLSSLTSQIIEQALALSDNNTSHAASLLGISPRTVQRHLAQGSRHR